MSSEQDLKGLVADAVQGLLEHLRDLVEAHVNGQQDLRDLPLDATLRLIGRAEFHTAADAILAKLRKKGSPLRSVADVKEGS